MERDSGSVTAAFQGCRSAVGVDCAPRDRLALVQGGRVVDPSDALAFNARANASLVECALHGALDRDFVVCARMSWKTSAQIAWSELAVGSLVPASGAAGLALGGVDPAPRRHARRPDRAALGGVLPDQELGQLRGRRGAGHGGGDRARRPRTLAASDGAAGGAGCGGDRARARDPAAGTRSRAGPGRLPAAPCGRRRSPRRDRRDRGGRRDPALARSDRPGRRDRLLGLRQRRPVGHLRGRRADVPISIARLPPRPLRPCSPIGSSSSGCRWWAARSPSPCSAARSTAPTGPTSADRSRPPDREARPANSGEIAPTGPRR